MNCPVCGHKSCVLRTIFKKDFTVRYRKCLNKKCKHRFKTMEQEATGWIYKTIVKKIQDIVKDVD